MIPSTIYIPSRETIEHLLAEVRAIKHRLGMAIQVPDTGEQLDGPYPAVAKANITVNTAGPMRRLVTSNGTTWTEATIEGNQNVYVFGADVVSGTRYNVYRDRSHGTLYCFNFSSVAGGGDTYDQACDCEFVKLQFRYAELDGRLQDEYATGVTIQDQFVNVLACKDCRVGCFGCLWKPRPTITFSGLYDIPDLDIDGFEYSFTATNLNATWPVPVIPYGTTAKWVYEKDISAWFSPTGAPSPSWTYHELRIICDCDTDLVNARLLVSASIRHWNNSSKATFWGGDNSIMGLPASPIVVPTTACAPNGGATGGTFVTTTGVELPTVSYSFDFV